MPEVEVSGEARRIQFWLESDQGQHIAEAFSLLHPSEAAAVLEELPADLRDDALKTLPPEQAAHILEHMFDEEAAQTVIDMTPQEAAPIVQLMDSDEAADLLLEIIEEEPEHAEAILERVDAEEAAEARELLAYDEDTAGGLMQKEFIAVPRGQRAADVVAHLRGNAKEYQDYPASYIYVVDDGGRLDGVLSMRELVLCDADARIIEITTQDPRSVPADMPGRELVEIFQNYELLVIPVTDVHGRLIGVVTQDDAMHFAEEEADEELLRFGGIVGGEELRSMSLGSRFPRRLQWLLLSAVLTMAAASVIAIFEETVESVIALAVFLPVLAGISGCSGSQAIAVSIRELSTGRIEPHDYLWVLGKEAAVGVINGLVLGFLVACAATIWQGNLNLGLLLGGALWVSTVLAVVIGGLVPLGLRKLGKDPALASGLILTTIVDLVGFLLVLSLACQFIDYIK